MPNGFLPIGEVVNNFVKFITTHGDKVFDFIGLVVGNFTEFVEKILQGTPIWLMVTLTLAIGFWKVGWRFALFCAAAFGIILGTNFWVATITTLSLIVVSTFLALFIGIPLGILMTRSNRLAAILRPVLDFMQTMPAFVHLIPVAMLFGLGKVPAVFATVVFAMPPVIRLTNLGIRQVNKEQVEAGITFGCTPLQLLIKVQIPGAIPSIMAGINQTIMMALSMVIITSMVGAGGLGNDVLKGIQQLDVGLGFESGLNVVLLAIMLDRITESFGQQQKAASLSLYERITKIFRVRHLEVA